MTEQDPAQQRTAQIDPEPPPFFSASAKIGDEPKEDKAKWTDKTMAFFTVLLFLAAVIQAVIFYRQLGEMHSGGDDTHTLALSADAQAKAAKAQADEAKAQVDKMTESLTKTDRLIKEATVQAAATNALAVQAQWSADYAEKNLTDSQAALHLEESPWVGIVSVATNKNPPGGEAFAIGLENYGKSLPLRCTRWHCHNS